MKMWRKGKRSVLALAFGKATARIEKFQRKVANYLNQKCAKLSTWQLKLGLALFCITFGCAGSFTIWHSLESFGNRSKVVTISVPKHIRSTDSVATELRSPAIISIQKFRFQLDSLQRNEPGRYLLDSITRCRPGLLDSLQLVENIYHLKSK